MPKQTQEREFLQFGPPLKGKATGFLASDGARDASILQALEAELSATFFTGVPGLEPRHRQRFMHALFTIKTAFEKLGFSRTATAELAELAVALSELDQGTVRHFLKPVKAHNRSAGPMDIWRARAWICIAADMMIEEGYVRGETFSWIAKAFFYLWPALSPGSRRFSGSTIQNWFRAFEGKLDQMQIPQGMRDMFRDRHKVVIEASKKCPHATRDERFDWLVSGLIDEAISDAARSSSSEVRTQFRKLKPLSRAPALPGKKREPTSAYNAALLIRADQA